MILVDTSVLIDLLKGNKSEKVDFLAALELQGLNFSIPAICAQEILQGARDSKELKLLKEYLITQDLVVSSEPKVWHFEAAEIYFDCRRKGLTIRSMVDCLVAQLAIENQAYLVANDRDYMNIAKVRKLLLK